MGTGGSNEDDLTIKLKEIMDVNIALETALDNRPLTRTIMEEWDFCRRRLRNTLIVSLLYDLILHLAKYQETNLV